MSFLQSAFSGASNNYTPQSPYAPGTQASTFNFVPGINTAQANYQAATQGQNSLAQMLQQQAQGQGPNPAQAMLNQQTGQNVSNQAALMAGQRGTSSNPGLIARQAAQQGAQTQQQAIGQGAILNANQQLGAESNLGNLYGQQVVGANQNLATNVGGFTNQNANIASAASSNNQQRAQIAQNNAQMNQGLIGGVSNGILSFAAGAGGAGGGQVIPMAQGGFSLGGPGAAIDPSLAAPGGNSFGFSSDFKSGKAPKDPTKGATNDIQDASGVQGGAMSAGPDMGAGGADPTKVFGANGGSVDKLPFALFMGHGGQIPAVLSPGEKYLKPHEVQAVLHRGASPAELGERIPGTAPVKGDSYQNDVYPKKLDIGGVVFPRSVEQAPNPEAEEKKFLEKISNKEDFKGALQRSIKSRKSS